MSFGEIITWPFAKLLLLFYELVSNYGLAIILFALVLKLVLLPFQMKSKRSMMRTTRLAPIMKELEKKHEGNPRKYQEEVAKLYREEKINPMSGCLWTLIPFPIIIALYSVIRQPLTRMMRVGAENFETIKEIAAGLGHTMGANAYGEIGLANFIHENFSAFEGITDKLVDLDFSFLGMNLGLHPQFNFFTKVDWSSAESWAPALGLFLIPIISGLLSYLSMKISNAGQPAAAEQQGMMKGMMLMMPLFSVYICFIMPAALGIYWIASSVFAIIQDVILNKHFNKILDEEDKERREKMAAREAEIEKKRIETEKLREMGATERNKNTSKKKIQAVQKAADEERMAKERADEKARKRAEMGISDDKSESQVGARRYARGRAYVQDRYSGSGAAQVSAVDDEIDAKYENENTDAVETKEGADK